MIICPNCKEEIYDDSHYCDQCGQVLTYCEKCGRVGMGRRCTSCGGLMLSAEDYHNRGASSMGVSMSMSMGMSQGFVNTSQRYLNTTGGARPMNVSMPQCGGMPQLLLYHDSLGIRIIGINGGVIGRRQGPYVQFFQQQKYMSSVHAQLMFYPETGWHIVDKHSSNGTKLNDHKLQPDVEMSLKNGDSVTLANVVLKVSLN